MALLHTVPNGDLAISPAITLEQGESMIVNIGQRDFKYFTPSASSDITALEGEESVVKRGIYDLYLATARTAEAGAGASEDPAVVVVAEDENLLLKELQFSEERKQFNLLLKEFQTKAAASSSSSGVSAVQEGAVSKSYNPIAIESSDFATAKDLEAFGLEHLKSELTRRGLKSGGTLTERAERLFSVRGIPFKKIDKRLKIKK
jgi:hypothetical protein